MIRFDNVGLRYGSGPEILRDVTFHVLPGSFHFLTGPSGAGKTSLLRLLFMSLRPSRGLIFVFGENVGELSAAGRSSLRRRIGIVFQDFRLLDHLTTWENVALPLRVMGKREADYREDVTDLLRWVGLGDRINAYPEVLSGGAQQRRLAAAGRAGEEDEIAGADVEENVVGDSVWRFVAIETEEISNDACGEAARGGTEAVADRDGLHGIWKGEERGGAKR